MDPKVICEEFNNYFITIGDKITKQIPATNDRPQDFLDQKVYPTCFLSTTSLEEIKTTITHLKQSSSPGPDNIHPSTIKLATPYISPILVTLINYSFVDAIFPSILKQALVIPIYKADDKKDLSNYRPISVLNAFSKIYESIIKNRMMSHIDKHNIIFNHQYGFRKNHSTYMSIISLIDKITENLNNNDYTLALFLDFQKAFDSVNHNILLYKLEHYGIRGQIVNLVKSYLENRTQKVKFNNCTSEYQKVTIGVPQGSILGPLFFLYILMTFPKSPTYLPFSSLLMILHPYAQIKSLQIYMIKPVLFFPKFGTGVLRIKYR